jgi:CRP-like cAMP-binding protein
MRNKLLEALPRDVYQQLQDNFEHVSLPRGEVLHRAGERIRHLYFPLTCLVSITVTMRAGRTAEAGVVGSREVVGVNAFMGGSETTQTEYVVQIEGDALKMDAQPLLQAFDANKAVRDVLLKYTQAMIAQLSQNAACNRLHNIEQRCARWLLEVRDRIDSEDLRLTHEFMGEMLGVSRPTVTQTLATLESRQLITVSRGLTRIADALGLEGTACECYRVILDEFNRLLGNQELRHETES